MSDTVNMETRLCKCGCGREVFRSSVWVNGHWSRTPEFREQARVRNLGERNPTKRLDVRAKRQGRVLSKESRQNMSLATSGARNSQYGKSRSEDVKRRIAKSMVRAWRGGVFDNVRMYVAHGDYYSGVWYRSPEEISVAKRLNELDIRFQYELKRFDLGDCTYSPDFYLSEDDIWIEIKGWMSPESEQKIARFWYYRDETLYVLLGDEKDILEQLETVLEVERGTKSC